MVGETGSSAAYIFAVDKREHDEGSRQKELNFSCTNLSLIIETSALALYMITSVASSEPHSSCNLQIPSLVVVASLSNTIEKIVRISHSQPWDLSISSKQIRPLIVFGLIHHTLLKYN